MARDTTGTVALHVPAADLWSTSTPLYGAPESGYLLPQNGYSRIMRGRGMTTFVGTSPPKDPENCATFV